MAMRTLKMLSVAGVLAVAAPARAEECTVLVDFALGEAGAPGYVFVEVDAGASPRAGEPEPGLAVGWQGRRILLDVQQHERRRTSVFGQVEETFAAVRAIGEESRTWIDTDPGLDLPEERVAAEWYGRHPLRVVSVLGPYVSFDAPAAGYAGGAHEYDASSFFTVRAPFGRRVHAGSLLGEKGEAAVEHELARTLEETPVDNPPDLEAEALSDAAFTPDGDALRLSALLFCCTWAQNHNLLELEVKLPQVSPELQRLLPRGGAFPGPKGCGSVAVEGGAVTVKREGVETKVADVEGGRLLGVSWLGRAPVDDKAYADALRVARAAADAGDTKKAIEGLDAALAARPDDATALLDKGWILFKNKELRDASAATWLALAVTDDAKLEGAALYNLGRMAEARGDRTEAARLYRASLEKRPSDAVKGALSALEATKP